MKQMKVRFGREGCVWSGRRFIICHYFRMSYN